ncbi:MAG: hypothetical protein AAGI68_04445 [Planctomycetota bacterium]
MLVILINLAAAGAGVAWLYASGRLDQARLDRLIDLFTPTVAEEQAQLAAAEQAEQEVAEQAARLERLAAVATGPISVDQRLAANAAADDYTRELLGRLQTDIKSIQDRVAQDRRLLQAERDELDQREAAFEEFMRQRTEQLQDEDFKQAVKALSELKPAQARDTIDALIARGQQDQAVEYLAAMNSRKAAGILRQYQDPADAGQLADLIEALRQRTLTPDATPAS